MTKPRFLPFVLTIAACSNPFGPSETSRLSQAWETWHDLLIETYEIDFERTGCECVPASVVPIRARVTLDSMVSATRLSDGAGIPEDDLQLFLTVEDVFRIIENAIDQNAFRLEVAYDDRFGFPLAVQMDIDEMIADDEVGFTLRNLNIITTFPKNPQP